MDTSLIAKDFFICLFLFLTGRYYFSDANKKNSYRSLQNIDQKINTYSKNIPILEDDTKNIIEYVEQSSTKKKKKFSNTKQEWKKINLNLKRQRDVMKVF